MTDDSKVSQVRKVGVINYFGFHHFGWVSGVVTYLVNINKVRRVGKP